MTMQYGRPWLGGVQNYVSTSSVHQTRITPPPASNRLRGTVKMWFDRQGYGFISTPDGEEHFVHCNDVVCFEGTKKRLYAGESVEFDLILGSGGRHRAIKVMSTGALRGIQRQAGSSNNDQCSLPLPLAYQPLHQQPPQLHTHHIPRPISSGNYSHPFPPPFPAGFMPHSAHPMSESLSPLACQQFPMGLQHPHMILQQHHRHTQQFMMVNSVGYNGPPIVGDARRYQHGTGGNAPVLYDESSRSPHKSATQGSSREKGQVCMVNEHEMLETGETHSQDIHQPSRSFDLNVCSVSIPGDIMIVRGTVNLLGSRTSLGEFYDILHTHKWYGADAKDEHSKILLFLESAPFEFFKLYKEFEFFYQGPGHCYPVRLFE